MLPKDLDAALQALEADTELIEQVGKDVVVRYVRVKKAEIDLLNGMHTTERIAVDYGEVLRVRIATKIVKFCCFFSIHCFYSGNIFAPSQLA